MTIASENDRFTPLTPSTGSTTLAWDFELVREDALIVERTRAGTTTTLTLGVDYSFPAGLGSAAGGTLTLAVDTLAGDTFKLIGRQPLQRQSDFSASTGFSTEKINADLDYLTRAHQEARRDIDRAFKAPYGASGKRIDVISEGHVPIADADGNLLEGPTGDAVANAQALAEQVAEDAAQTAADRLQTALDRIQTGLDRAVTVAAAAALAAAVGATVYETKALADAALAGLSEGARVLVLVDESRSNQCVLYRKTSGAYVYLLTLGDLTVISNAAKRGANGHRLTHAFSTLAKLDREAWGQQGPGGYDLAPLAITAAQSGSTLTATANWFSKDYIRTVAKAPDGRRSMIVTVPGTSGSLVSTATLADSRTVSSGAWTVDVKPLTFLFMGDSLADETFRSLATLLYHRLGFGGLWFTPNYPSDTSAGMFGTTVFSGGAAVAGDLTTWDIAPYGKYYNVPSGGGVQIELQTWTPDRTLDHGLSPEQMQVDTLEVLWRQDTGAFVIEEKLAHEHGAAWRTIATQADASAGGGSAIGSLSVSVDLRHDRQFRLRSTSGTIKVHGMCLRNAASPGFLPCIIGQGSAWTDSQDIVGFVNIDDTVLTEIMRAVMPDTMIHMTSNAGTAAQSVATQKAWLTNFDTKLLGAWPHMDIARADMWRGSSNDAGIDAQRDAVREHCILNNQVLLPTYDLFGDFTARGSYQGMVQNGVHTNVIGGYLVAGLFLAVTGFLDHPSAHHRIGARFGNFRDIALRGRDLGDRIRRLETRPANTAGRGAKWYNYQLVGSIGGAIGTGDFTFHARLKLPDTDPAVRYLLKIGSDGTSASEVGQMVITQEGALIRLYLQDASGNTITYSFSGGGGVPANLTGKTGELTVRVDASEGRIDVLWDGNAIEGLTGTIVGTTTSPLGTWAGTGAQAGIAQGATDARSDYYYSAMFWRNYLTDDQVRECIENQRPPAGNIPDFWLDFAEGIGRVVQDKSGNGRDAMFQAGASGSAYNIGAGPTWAHPKRKVTGAPWVASIASTTQLMSGDDVIAAYTANRDMLLPATPAVGDQIRVTVNSTYLIRITQNAGQQIKSGASATTAGTGGHLTIPNASSVLLKCVVGGASALWIVEESAGAALTFA
jgi:hypothetical protein